MLAPEGAIIVTLHVRSEAVANEVRAASGLLIDRVDESRILLALR
jgi:hypothetical protein